MGIVADSRAADINRWFDDQYGDLQGHCRQPGGPSLSAADRPACHRSQPGRSDRGVKEYLRNIITVTADRSGFTVKTQTNVDVNETQPALGGILIDDEKGEVLAASPNAPAFDGDSRRLPWRRPRTKGRQRSLSERQKRAVAALRRADPGAQVGRLRKRAGGPGRGGEADRRRPLRPAHSARRDHADRPSRCWCS